LPVTRLESAKRKSASLHDIFSRYGDSLLAETFQSIACNAAHSIEARAAKWIISIMGRIDSELVALTHDELSNLLGVGRSYASRVIQAWRAEGIVETGRGSFLVRDRAALERKACACMNNVRQHYSEILGQER
jgi:CRP-like cAMP-binding protein